MIGDCHNDTIYKKLRTITEYYLRVVGYSVPPECLFSVAAMCSYAQQEQVAGERLGNLFYLKSFDDKVWDIE